MSRKRDRVTAFLRRLFCTHDEPLGALLNERHVFVSYGWSYDGLVDLAGGMMAVKVRCERCGAQQVSKAFRAPSEPVALEAEHVGT